MEPTRRTVARTVRISPAALSDGFRSGRLPPLSEALRRAYPVLGAEHRARLLGHLLTAVGPLALGVLGAGRFAKLMFRERWGEVAVSVDDVSGLSAAHFAEIVRYVEQSDPTVLLQAVSLMASDGGSLMVLGATALGLLWRATAARRRTQRTRRRA